jgi:hypothetical protein
MGTHIYASHYAFVWQFHAKSPENGESMVGNTCCSAALPCTTKKIVFKKELGNLNN